MNRILTALMLASSIPGLALAGTISIAGNGGSVYFQEVSASQNFNAASLGQTFVVPTPVTDTTLNSFAFTLTNSTDSTFDYRAYVFQWDNVNHQATGAPLFTSAAQNGTQAPSFSGLNIVLTAGTTYIALLTTQGVANNSFSNGFLASNGSDVYAGGQQWQQSNVPSNGSTGNGSWASTAWTAGSGDFQFSASFGPTILTPEPASLGLMALGMGALALLRRR